MIIAVGDTHQRIADLVGYQFLMHGPFFFEGQRKPEMQEYQIITEIHVYPKTNDINEKKEAVDTV